MQEYETTFVIDSLLKSEEIEGIVNKYERFISANGGEIKTIDHWGKKRLAYEIKKRQYGYYVYVRYTGPPNLVKSLEREFRLNESILRYLSVKLTSKMLKREEEIQSRRAAVQSKESPEKKNRSPEAEQTTSEDAQTEVDTSVAIEAEATTEVEQEDGNQGEEKTKSDEGSETIAGEEPEITLVEDDEKSSLGQ